MPVEADYIRSAAFIWLAIWTGVVVFVVLCKLAWRRHKRRHGPV